MFVQDRIVHHDNVAGTCTRTCPAKIRLAGPRTKFEGCVYSLITPPGIGIRGTVIHLGTLTSFLLNIYVARDRWVYGVVSDTFLHEKCM